MIKIANAPCSWGALEFDLSGEAPGYVQVLDEIVETGYAGTELGDWGFMPTDPEQLAASNPWSQSKIIRSFRSRCSEESGCTPPGIEIALKIARLMAAVENNLPFIILADENGSIPERTQNVGRVKPEMGLSQSEWQIFAEGASKVAEAVKRETGLRTAFHHHCAGYVETPTEIATLMNLTDPDLLGLVFDCGHYAFGGGDPLEGLKKYGKRVWHFHFKDHQLDVHDRVVKRKSGLLSGSERRSVL